MPSNECTPSTTWAYRKVKISRRPPGLQQERPKGSSGPRRRPVDPKLSHSIVIEYRGGAEAWWKIRYQGEIYVAPGHMAVHDVFMWFLDGNRGAASGGSSRRRKSSGPSGPGGGAGRRPSR